MLPYETSLIFAPRNPLQTMCADRGASGMDFRTTSTKVPLAFSMR
jgi:hypothetical protein